MLPSVPRIFEKVYSVAMSMVPDGSEEAAERRSPSGCEVRQGAAVRPTPSAPSSTRVDGEMFALVRGIFGGQIKFAVSGAAPISPEILEFFFAAGVPVYEGWGMTGDDVDRHPQPPRRVQVRHDRSSGRRAPTMRIAEDGEIQIAGECSCASTGTTRRPPPTSIDAGRLPAHRRPRRVDADGYVTITGRKKDIIITAGGKNLTPANLEGDLRQSRWISQAVMFGDRRPFPVALITLDPEQIVPWAEQHGPADRRAGAGGATRGARADPGRPRRANAQYAQVEQIKRFTILPRDFTQEAGELTPSLKLKRNVVYAATPTTSSGSTRSS